MKIAIVLSGYFGTISTNDMTNGRNTSKRLKRYFKDHDTEYFIHSWQMSAEDEVRELYNPTELVFEPQIDFNPIAKNYGISQDWFDEGFNRSSTMYKRATIFNSLSFFNSRSKALKLLDGEFDWVFVMRLDVGHVGPSSVNFPSTFDFSSDTSKIYSPYWNQLNVGLGDMWTIMNVENAHKLSNIYNKVMEYYKSDSNYVHDMLNGWPMSEKHDFNKYNTPESQSNICISGKKTELMTYPKWYCVNNHAIYKYFFYDMNMFNKIKFI